MKKILSVFICMIMIFSLFIPVTAATENDKLSFGQDGKFTILQLTDTQDDHYPAYDMLNLVRRAVEESKPDLIVFTGDIVEDSRAGDVGVDGENGREGVTVKDSKGNVDFEKTLDNVKKAVDAVFSILEQAGVPYVVAQGNNDHKCGISNSDWLEIYSQYPNCIVLDESDDSEDRIDRNILIYGNDDKPKFNLWIMDTDRGGINDDQIDWYKRKSAEITAANGGEPVPAIVFQHIQIPDIGNLFEPCKVWDDGATAKGTSFYRLNKDIASGYNFYAYTPGETSKEFAAWKECGDVIGAFFGHQHVDGFSGTFDGIEMGFTFGAEFAKIGPYGYRVFTLYEDDILNYDNDLFVYEGKVKLGTDKITKQVDEGYPVYENSFSEFFAKIKNLIKNMFTLITSLFG